MVSALWGLLVWKEFAGASGRVRVLVVVMLVLLRVWPGADFCRSEIRWLTKVQIPAKWS